MSSVGFLVQKASCRPPRFLTWPLCEGWSGFFVVRNSSDLGFRFDQRHRRVECVFKDKLPCQFNSVNRCKDAINNMSGNKMSARPSDFGANRSNWLPGLRSVNLSAGQCKTRVDIVAGTVEKSIRRPKSTWTIEDRQPKRYERRMQANISNSATGCVVRPVTPSLFMSPLTRKAVNIQRSFSTVSRPVLLWTVGSTDPQVGQATAAVCVTTWRAMAGHSKWQNIRHIKSAKDGQKAEMFSKMALKIKLAVREGGSDDPKHNNPLARILTQAKAKDMPNASIAAAIKAGSNKEVGSPLTVEIKGPGQCLWIVETITDKPIRTKAEIRGMLKKNGCVVSEGNTVIRAFEKKGVVEVEMEDDKEIDMDKYLEVAIESGAEDVQKREDDVGSPYLAFVCDAADLHSVKKAVAERELPVKSAFHEYVARVPTVLPESEVASLQAILEKLQGHTEVIRVFDNIQVQES
ncbi:translational activator of cytochrome c oxidase 1-like [Liolophura sinensis]|uniref:translational activator of cytochrome c oxidase 1-like n=1 Tax=Liolophura sinensis TaxID=3198878 RepID=UPI003158D073